MRPVKRSSTEAARAAGTDGPYGVFGKVMRAVFTGRLTPSFVVTRDFRRTIFETASARLRAVRRGVVLGLLLAAAPARAAAAEPALPRATLAYQNRATEPSCPGEREFRDRVVGRLGADPFVASAERSIAVSLRDDGARRRVHAEIVATGPGTAGRRELVVERAECAELGDALAVAVSLILDPLGTAASRAEPAHPTEPAPPPAPVERRADATPAPAPSTADRSALALALEGAALASVGRGPAPTLGGRLGARAWKGAWGLGIEGTAESTAGFVRASDEQATTLFVFGGASACHRRALFVGCAIASIGLAQGELESRAGVRRTAAAFAGLRLGAPLCARAGVCVVPSFDLVANVVRSRLRADGVELWTAPPVSATFALALSLAP